jgi:hypothetical protein
MADSNKEIQLASQVVCKPSHTSSTACLNRIFPSSPPVAWQSQIRRIGKYSIQFLILSINCRFLAVMAGLVPAIHENAVTSV